MLIGILLLVLANAASLLAARALLFHTRTGTRSVDILLLLVLRLGLISALVLVAGLTHILDRAGLALACAAGMGIALVPRRNRTLPRASPLAWGWGWGLALGLVAVRFIIQSWLFVPCNDDALSYHLPKVAEWVRSGGFSAEMGSDTHVTLPAGFELMEVWWTVFLRHDVLIEMAGMEFLVLAFASCYALAERFGADPRSACMAGLFFVLVPGIHLQATSGLNDASVAATLAAALTLIAVRAPLGITLLAVGLGAGLKGTFLYAASGLACLDLAYRARPRMKESHPAVLFALVGLGAWIGGFWYLRNWAWYGNPVYPLGLGGLNSATGEQRIQLGPNVLSGVRNIANLFVRVYRDFVPPYSVLLKNQAGWGPMAVVVGGVGAAWGLRRSSDLRKLGLACTVSLLSVLILVRPDPWNLRFTLFFPLFLCVGLTCLPWQVGYWRVILVLGFLWQFGVTSLPAEVSPSLLGELWSTGWRDRSLRRILGPEISTDAIAYYVNEPTSRRGEAYSLYGPDFGTRVVYLRVLNPGDIERQMLDQNVNALYVSRSSTLPDSFIEGAVQKGFLKETGLRMYQKSVDGRDGRSPGEKGKSRTGD